MFESGTASNAALKTSSDPAPPAAPADKPISAGAPSSRWRGRLAGSWIYLVLIALYVIFGIITLNHVFFSLETLRNIFVDSAELLILATGATLVIIAGEIDLSVGPVLVLASAAAGETMIHLAPAGGGLPTPLVIVIGALVGLAAGAAMGAINGLLVVYLKIPSFLVTLGTLSVALGLAEVITHGVDITGVPQALQTDFGVKQVLGIPLVIPASVVICAVFAVLLSATRFGRHTYGIGSNKEAARRSGINVGRHLIWVFVLAGILSGATGVVDLSRFGTTNVGGHTTDALLAISAVAIGGASIYGGSGKMSGTIAGVFIPVVIADGLVVRGVQPFWQQVAIGVLILVAVAIDINRRSRRGGRQHR